MGLIARIKSEYLYLSGALRSLKAVTKIAEAPSVTIADQVETWASNWGANPALIDPHETFSFTKLNARANQYARWASANGITKGDTVALLMPNRAEYMAAWMGVAKVGGITACLNTNLSDRALAHCINIVDTKLLIADENLFDNLQTTNGLLEQEIPVWCLGSTPAGTHDLGAALDEQDDSNLSDAERAKLTTSDTCLYIYTSGTTGLPKAANLTHYRTQSVMAGFAAAGKYTANDRIYVCLPMYHTTGGILAPGSCLWHGGSVVLAEKFSASHFWKDIVANECTAFQYIGELCRYLLNTDEHPDERRHNIRIANGNGLRPDIWVDFQKRFNIPQILEWYAATEGNAVYFNFDQKVGAVGRVPKWAEKKFVTEVVEFDIDKEEPVRGPDGYCIKCPPNGTGEVISKILNDPKRPSQRFDGYADEEATKKKILRNAFEEGDAWFRTGDLMRKDELGYMYFVDRIGDTFRWKGENVATSEVSEACTGCPGLLEANVYGVAIPGMDGRAGMAALVTDSSFEISNLASHLKTRLPAYALPVFIRIKPDMEVTGTFKQRKVDLVKEGFDPSVVSDDLYFLNPETGQFEQVDTALYDAICSGKFRF